MQDGFIQIAFIVITIIANRRGLNDAAAVGIVEKMISLFFLVPSSMLSTVSALCAQNIGAGKHDRASQTLACATTIAVSYGIVISILIQFTGHHIVSLFSGNADVMRFCRNPLLFQRIFLCLRSFRNLLFTQHSFRCLCPYSAGLSGIKILSGQPVSHGLCCSGRIPAFCIDLRHCLCVDEKSARTESILSMQTDRTAHVPALKHDVIFLCQPP